MLNCTTGTIENSHFSKWTPLTGVYIAAATLVCTIAIIVDLVQGLRCKLCWIPSGYSSINSVSLTILGAATKLSTDLSTTMPQHMDQLAKLGTSAFMCIALANVYPSLGKLENSELQSNTVALSILVISSIVSVCIQLRTEVIYTFKAAHITMITMMSLLLVHWVLSASHIRLCKYSYQACYQEEDQSVRKEWVDLENSKHPSIENLKEYLKRFSMLAHSGCPQFLLGRSGLGTLPTVWGLVAAVTFFVIQITSLTHRDKVLASTSCESVSAYNWSVLWILVTQNLALGVGTIVLITRGCYIAMLYLKIRMPPLLIINLSQSEGSSLKGDDLWAIWLLQHIEIFEHKPERRLVDKLMDAGYLLYKFCPVILHGLSVIVMTFIYSFCISTMTLCSLCIQTIRNFICRVPYTPCPSPTPGTVHLASEEEKLIAQYLLPSVIIEYEARVKWIAKSIVHITEKYTNTKERETNNLEELLGQYLSPDFRGVVTFDSEEVDPLDSQESPPNCWSLHLVTLMEIAVALPNVDRHSLCELIKGVNEGLVFVKLIEDKFNQELHFSAIKCGAYFLWMKKFGLKSFKDLVKPAVHNESPMEILESIATSAKKKSIATDGWAEVVAHSKYRLCEKILLEHRNENGSSRDDLQPCPMSGRIFAKLRATIADILGACLANLKHYILTECSDSSSIEKRREAAARILKLFGNAEKIMEIVERREIPDMSPEKMVYIDNWRDYYKSQRQSP